MASGEANTAANRGPATVLLVTRDPQYQGLVSELLQNGIVALLVRSLAELTALMRLHAQRAVAVLDVDDPEFGTAALDLLHAPPTIATLLLLGRENLSGSLAGSVVPGPNDDLALKPLTDQEALLRVRALIRRSGFALTSETVDEVQQPSAGRYAEGRSVVVFGAKGGVGKTTMAVNLALGLTRLYGLQVLLEDADLWFGDLAVLLNLPMKRSVADLPADFDLPSLQQALTPHSSGLMTLLSPSDPVAVEKLPGGTLAKAAALGTTVFDYVVVDTHPSFDEGNLQLLEESDLILLITTPELSAIRNTSHFLDISRSLGIVGKIRLILNRANSGIREDALEHTLDFKISATVVSAGKLAVQAANEGVPVIERDVRAESQIARDLRQVAALVVGRAPTEAHAKTKGILSWGRRKDV